MFQLKLTNGQGKWLFTASTAIFTLFIASVFTINLFVGNGDNQVGTASASTSGLPLSIDNINASSNCNLQGNTFLTAININNSQTNFTCIFPLNLTENQVYSAQGRAYAQIGQTDFKSSDCIISQSLDANNKASGYLLNCSFQIQNPQILGAQNVNVVFNDSPAISTKGYVYFFNKTVN